MKKHLQLLSIVVFLLLFFTLPLTCYCYTADLPETPPAEEQGQAVDTTPEGLVSGLSDEQARRMLLEELRTQAGASQEKSVMQGPGAVLDEIIHGLEVFSVTAGSGVHSLFAGMPNVLPDLYRVFVTL